MPQKNLVATELRQRIKSVGFFVGFLWLVFLADLVLPGTWTQWGLRPRTTIGLLGIPTMPFLHGSIGHLLSNSVPLVVLLSILSGSRSNPFIVVASIILYGGGLLWLFGRSDVHIGASGLVYGLVAFLILHGFFERRILSILISLLVGCVYGTTLLWGVLPSLDSQVSWDGHLCGAIAGGIIAYLLSKPASPQPTVITTEP